MFGGTAHRRGYIRARPKVGRSWNAPAWAFPAAAVAAAILLAVAMPLAALRTHNRLLAAGWVPEELGGVSGRAAQRASVPWAVVCTADRRDCAVEQKVVAPAPQGGEIVLLRVTLGPPAGDGSRRLVIAMPPDIRTDKGIVLQVGGDGPENRLGVETCTPGACTASVAVDAAGLARLESAHLLHITYIAHPGGRMVLPIGLDRLSEALRQLALVQPVR